MTVFGTEAEQAVLDALTDEALAAAGEEAEEATPDGLPEEVAEDNTEAEETPSEPQEEAAAEPGTEPEQEPAAEPAVETEIQPEPAAPDTVEKSRYEAAVREMNAKQREAAELNKRIAELEKQNRELQDSALQMSFNQPMTEEEQTAFLQGLRDNPRQTMMNMLSPVLTSMMDQRQKEERQRFDEMQRKQASDQTFRDAFNKMVADYPQLKDPENGSAVLNKMFAMAENAIGNGPESWRQAPELFLREAVFDMYGVPVKIDQNSIEAAKKRGYEEGLAQRQQREADKAKATPAATAAPQTEPPLTEEDKIIRDMMAIKVGHVF